MPGLLVVVGVVFERLPRVGIDQLASGELVASAAQLWSVAVAARELGNACLLPCTVGRHQPADRFAVAPAWRHWRRGEVRVERIVDELARQRGERGTLDRAHRFAEVEQQLERGRARLAELLKVLTARVQTLLL